MEIETDFISFRGGGLNRFLKVALWLFLLLALNGAAQGPSQRGDIIGPLARILPVPPHYHFPDGQTLVYAAEWRIWSAGTATLRIDSAGPQQHVSATADSIGVVALLYRVHDHFDSWFDTPGFCSQRITKHTEEGLRRRDTAIRFDYPRRKAVLEETNLRDGQTKHAEEDIPGCATDVLSGLYYVPSLPLQLGVTYRFPLNDGGRTVEVSATAEAREQVKTDAGVFSTVRVRVDAKPTEPKKEGGQVWLWCTDDAQRLPVQMRSRLFWGTMTLKLQRVQK